VEPSYKYAFAIYFYIFYIKVNCNSILKKNFYIHSKHTVRIIISVTRYGFKLAAGLLSSK